MSTKKYTFAKKGEMYKLRGVVYFVGHNGIGFNLFRGTHLVLLSVERKYEPSGRLCKAKFLHNGTIIKVFLNPAWFFKYFKLVCKANG